MVTVERVVHSAADCSGGMVFALPFHGARETHLFQSLSDAGIGVMRRRVLLVAFGIGAGLAVSACQRSDSAPTMSDAARSALADSVRHQVAALLGALAHPVPDSILSVYDSTGFVWGRSGFLLSYDSLAASIRRTWTSGASAQIGTSDATVRVLGPDDVVWTGIISGVYRSAGGKESDVRGAVTLVLAREGTRWKIVAGHESVPPQYTAHESEVQSPPESRTK